MLFNNYIKKSLLTLCPPRILGALLLPIIVSDEIKKFSQYANAEIDTSVMLWLLFPRLSELGCQCQVAPYT